MRIVKAKLSDLCEIVEIYSGARAFMKEAGNPNQWGGAYPSAELIASDIKSENLYIVMSDEEEILAVFYYSYGTDPTYERIYEGAWQSAEPYGVIHRIAVSERARGKGVSAFCFSEMLKKSQRLRIDTHRDNLPMQRALGKFGFSYAGVIHIESGDERLAYEIEVK